MSVALPRDAEVARRLADVRVAVLEATTRVHSPKRSTRYRVTRNIIIAGVAAAALTAGAIAIARAAQETIDHVVFCYPDAAIGERPVQVDGDPDDFRPIGLCEVAWALDLFHDGQSEDDSHPVPDLVACTLPSEAAGVFPLGDARPEDFCAALGLADWDSD